MLVREATYPKKQSFAPSVSETDENLIAACVAGDNQAWEVLIEKYGRLIYSIPFRHGLSDNEAADIFQSVCLKLLENLHSLRDCTKLSSWLITTTTRECWNVTKRRARFPQKDSNATDEDQEQMDLSPLPEETAVWLEEQQTVREAYQLLPSRCQRLLWYLFYDKSRLPYSEIGKRLGLPDGSIGPMRARCLDRLRSLLEDADWS